MYKDKYIVLADGIDKRKTRRGYYRRIRYFRIEMKRFLNAHRKKIPTICLTCGYSTCRCGEVAA